MKRSALRVALCAGAAVALLVGWNVFWFQCDDAYIAFRYVSASQLGWGYTWNPPPFRPVEGYTSFLWVVLLDAVWRVFGAEPPVAANWLALLFSAASLALVVAMVLRLRLSPGLARWRTALLGLVLLGMVSNRTFLAWTSSGLETALFGFLLLLWVALALFRSGSRGSLAWLSLSAGLLALARPDGLLFAAATAGILLVRTAAAGGVSARALAPALPLLIPVVHVLWRRARVRLLAPEYVLREAGGRLARGGRALLRGVRARVRLLDLARAGAGGGRARARRQRARRAPARLGSGPRSPGWWWAPRSRCTSPTTPCAWAATISSSGSTSTGCRCCLISFAGIAERAGLSPRRTLAALAAMILLGWPLPWLHWSHTRHLMTRAETFKLHHRVAPHLPAAVRWYGAAWDDLEGWLIRHLVGLRHQEHKIFGELQVARFPARAIGAQISGQGHPVLAYHTVGVPGWVLPNVAILDWFGLNDVVIAHAKPTRATSEERQMAHDRGPPAGYIDCFRPNVFVRKKRGFSSAAARPRPHGRRDPGLRGALPLPV